MEYLPSEKGEGKVKEAAVEYIVSRREEPALTTISSKNQITLPAQLLRDLGLRAGDRLAISREGSLLVLRPRPKDWVEYHGGSLKGTYGKTAEELDGYVEGLRSEWER